MVLAVNAWDEEKGVVKRYVKKEKLKQRVLLDGGSLFESYGATSVPTVLFIDRKGIVVDAEVGFAGPDDLIRRTERLLGSD